MMKTFLPLALLVSVCTPLPAQFVSMYGNQSSMAQAQLANMRYLMNTSSMMLTLSLKAQTERQMRGRTGAPPAAAATLRPAPNFPAFTFPYQGRLLSMDEIAATLSDSPSVRQEASRELAVLVQTVAGELGQDGSAYDISKAFTFFTTSMYSVLHPETAIDAPASARLLRQFRSGILNAEAMKTAPPAKLQQQWETLLALGGYSLMTYELAVRRQDSALASSVRAAAALGLKTLFDTDASRLKIDPAAEWPLAIDDGSAPPQQAVSQASPPPAEPSQAGFATIRVGHHHFLTGMHPAELRLEPAVLVFDPLGQACNQSAVSVPYADVQVGTPAPNGNGELLLNVRMKNPANPRKTLNLNFVTADSTIDESSGARIVRSPAGAADRLNEIAAALRARGAH